MILEGICLRMASGMSQRGRLGPWTGLVNLN